jgi:hypothetical protein
MGRDRFSAIGATPYQAANGSYIFLSIQPRTTRRAGVIAAIFSIRIRIFYEKGDLPLHPGISLSCI